MSEASLKKTATTHLWMVWYRAPTPGSLKGWAFLLTPSSDETTSGTAYQAEGYDDSSDSASSLGTAASGTTSSGSGSDGGQYLMTITPDVPLRASTLSARGTTAAEGHIYLGALSPDAVAYFSDCCEMGIDILNTHNSTLAASVHAKAAQADPNVNADPDARGDVVTRARTHQDWVLDVVNALEDVAAVQLGTVGIVKACPRRGWQRPACIIDET